jgi:hypothetical protein
MFWVRRWSIFWLLTTTRDCPLLPTKGSQGTYLGRISTSDVVPDVTIYSTLGDFFGGANPDGSTAGAAAPISLLPYSELEFIKAEATFINPEHKQLSQFINKPLKIIWQNWD